MNIVDELARGRAFGIKNAPVGVPQGESLILCKETERKIEERANEEEMSITLRQSTFVTISRACQHCFHVLFQYRAQHNNKSMVVMTIWVLITT